MGLPLLLRVFDVSAVAAGLAINFAKTLVVNYGARSDFRLKRRLVEATGIAQINVARVGLYLGCAHRPRGGAAHVECCRF